MGPAVSCVADMGMMPLRLHKPTVGLIPTSALTEAGETMDPSVSVPTHIVLRLAAAAEPDPALEPEGFLSSIYGHLDCPPRLLHPLQECEERKFAHSLRLVFPSSTTPARRSCFIMKASSLA